MKSIRYLNYSISKQKDLGRKFAETAEFDYEIFEDNKPGGTVDRTGRQAFFEQVESGEIDGLTWFRPPRHTTNNLAALRAADNRDISPLWLVPL